MSVLFILIAISLFLASGFLIAFIWSVKKGQYEDEYTPSVRMLLDENDSVRNENEEGKSGVKVQ